MQRVCILLNFRHVSHLYHKQKSGTCIRATIFYLFIFRSQVHFSNNLYSLFPEKESSSMFVNIGLLKTKFICAQRIRPSYFPHKTGSGFLKKLKIHVIRKLEYFQFWWHLDVSVSDIMMWPKDALYIKFGIVFMFNQSTRSSPDMPDKFGENQKL